MAIRLLGMAKGLPWVTLLVVLGLALRAYHYLRNPSMWHDEAALVVNVLGKTFTELWGPLFFSEAAPPLFSCVERAVVLVLGDSTYALRLVPFLASCAALLLFVPVARRVLPASAVPWAVLLAACSDQILWHACEAKPYAVDVLAATVLAALLCCTDAWTLPRKLLVLAALAPLLVFLCYPACFLYGGVLVALLPGVVRARDLRTWGCYALLIGAVFGSFGILLTGPIRAQRDDTIVACWEGSFPDWARPWTVPAWTVFSSLEVFRYCCEPIGQVLFPLAVVGGVCLWRQGRRQLVTFLILPLGLALLASFARAYPYGGCRVVVYAAPALFLLIAAGVPATLAWATARGRWGPAVVQGLLVVPLGLALVNAAVPWPRADCAGAAAYVLAHRAPDDQVASNHWEYLYYFRHLGPGFCLLRAPVQEPAARLWLVITDAQLEARTRLAAMLTPPAYRQVERQEFLRTTVVLVARPE